MKPATVRDREKTESIYVRRIPMIQEGKIKVLTYISLRPYRQERLCRTPGSWRYASLVMSSTPDGGASVSLGYMLSRLATT